MGISILLGLSRFAPIDNPATVGGSANLLTGLIFIVGLILVILLIGFGVTLAHRPDKMIDEFGDEKGSPPPH
ncbi:hypothetical protein [Leifsonia sp. C5G2]|uniref:hypothetical protein n=1 Tax=Leifsonia sp. C5G2 TaxID=2735269 RepID=UPI0015854A93|nr:hypothetical protein [Leifsonia sp. C5G2]NUU06849.1 hypothetical protein [Leifsonia sp. C5G2]